MLVTAYNRFGADQFTASKIVRLTKTRIVVDGGRYERQFVLAKYGKDRWEEYGHSNSWQPTPYLVGGNSAEGRELYAQAAKQRVEQIAINACQSFIRDRSAENAQAAIDELAKYLEGGQ